MKILLYHSTKRINLNGQAPIWCRISKRGVHKEFSTGIYCSLDQWDKKGKAIKNDPIANTLLQNALQRLRLIWTTFEMRGEVLSVQKMIDLYKNQEQEPETPPPSPTSPALPIIHIYRASMLSDAIKKGLKGSTMDAMDARYNTFLDFLTSHKKLQLDITDINEDFCEHFWLYLKQTFNGLYPYKVFKQFSKALKYAVKKKYIDKDPSIYSEINKGTSKITPTIDTFQLLDIMATEFSYKPVQLAADLFILEAHTGLSHCDMKQLATAPRFFYNGLEWIYLERTKTNHEAIVPMLPKTKEYLDKYEWNPPDYSNYRLNKYLKSVSTILKLPFQLSSRIARKSFGQIMIDNGCQLTTVSRMLGHASTRTTEQHYVRIGVRSMAFDKHAIEQFGIANQETIRFIPMIGRPNHDQDDIRIAA